MWKTDLRITIKVMSVCLFVCFSYLTRWDYRYGLIYRLEQVKGGAGVSLLKTTWGDFNMWKDDKGLNQEHFSGNRGRDRWEDLRDNMGNVTPCHLYFILLCHLK